MRELFQHPIHQIRVLLKTGFYEIYPRQLYNMGMVSYYNLWTFNRRSEIPDPHHATQPMAIQAGSILP